MRGRLQPGDELPALSAPPVSRMRIAYMTVAMRDPNPVHVEDAAAQRAGLPGVIAHGTFVLGAVGAALTRTFGFTGVRRLRVGLTAPVRPGDQLTTGVTVTGGDGEGDGGLLELEISVRNGDGAVVATGMATIRAADGGHAAPPGEGLVDQPIEP